MDAHLEEQFDGSDGDPDPVFYDSFENGFRYYVHPAQAIPYLTSEGISVSPTCRVYSAISVNTYTLLPSERYGNCTSEWPPGFSSGALPYSAVNCDSICKADYFNAQCGCSPFAYNIGQVYTMCTPFQTVRCIDDHIRKTVDGVDVYDIPKCDQCKIECQSTAYHAYNSYGQGFSNGALSWLHRKNSSWSKPHIRANFVTINVFYRDMSFMQYSQTEKTSLTETLSDIGGNMGMFLGMSLITVIEILMYLSKVGWITLSKKRRYYMYKKKEKEMEHAKQLEETVSSFKMFRSRKVGGTEASSALGRLRAMTGGRKVARVEDPSAVSAELAIVDQEYDVSDRRSNFLENLKAPNGLRWPTDDKQVFRPSQTSLTPNRRPGRMDGLVALGGNQKPGTRSRTHVPVRSTRR